MIVISLFNIISMYYGHFFHNNLVTAALGYVLLCVYVK